MSSTAVLGPFAKLFEIFLAWSTSRDERIRGAVAALGNALAETRIYLRDEQSKGRDTEREAEIVRLWTEAGHQLQGLDAELAIVCLRKADYWLLPEGWSDSEITEKGIQIEALLETHRKLVTARAARLDRGHDSKA